MSRLRAFVNVVVALALLLGAAGWLVYSHRAVSVACQRAGGKVDCSDTERIAYQSYWPLPVWNVTVRDVDLTARSVDDDSTFRQGENRQMPGHKKRYSSPNAVAFDCLTDS